MTTASQVILTNTTFFLQQQLEDVTAERDILRKELARALEENVRLSEKFDELRKTVNETEEEIDRVGE